MSNLKNAGEYADLLDHVYSSNMRAEAAGRNVYSQAKKHCRIECATALERINDIVEQNTTDLDAIKALVDLEHAVFTELLDGFAKLEVQWEKVKARPKDYTYEEQKRIEYEHLDARNAYRSWVDWTGKERAIFRQDRWRYLARLYHYAARRQSKYLSLSIHTHLTPDRIKRLGHEQARRRLDEAREAGL